MLLVAGAALTSSAPAAAQLPADGVLVWASNREGGRHEIYLMQAGDKQAKRLTNGGGLQPSWSPDGNWIAYLTTNGYPSRIMRSDGSDDRQIHVGACTFWMHDGGGLVCMSHGRFTLVDPLSGEQQPLFEIKDFTKAQGSFAVGGITRDRRWVVAATDLYRLGFSGTNGTFIARWAAVALDLQNKDRIFFLGGGYNPTTAPTGTMIYHSCGGGMGECIDAPDIYRFDIADLPSRSSYAPEAAAASADWGHEYSARISTDGKWLTYVGSQVCHDQLTCDYEVFLHRLGTSHTSRTRLTVNLANDQHPHLFIPVDVQDEEGCQLSDRGAPRWAPLALALLLLLVLVGLVKRGLPPT